MSKHKKDEFTATTMSTEEPIVATTGDYEVENVTVTPAPETKWKFIHPKCGKTAIETSNQMLGIFVTCQGCGETFRLDGINNYKKI